MTLYLFYAGLLYGTFGRFPRSHELPNEVYQGGFIYDSNARKWYRCDITPVLIEDVPKPLQLQVLLLI